MIYIPTEFYVTKSSDLLVTANKTYVKLLLTAGSWLINSTRK
jgi:hypothetical protein